MMSKLEGHSRKSEDLLAIVLMVLQAEFVFGIKTAKKTLIPLRRWYSR